jgi:hypothetical protein
MFLQQGSTISREIPIESFDRSRPKNPHRWNGSSDQKWPKKTAEHGQKTPETGRKLRSITAVQCSAMSRRHLQCSAVQCSEPAGRPVYSRFFQIWAAGRRSDTARGQTTFSNICLFGPFSVDFEGPPFGCGLTICLKCIFRRELGFSSILRAATSVCFSCRSYTEPAMTYSSAAVAAVASH